METAEIKDIMKHMIKIADCEMKMNEKLSKEKKEITVEIKINEMPSESVYLLSFFHADGAGTWGIKIRWTIGKVTDFSEVWKSLVLNESKLIDAGPLFTAILPSDDDGLFSLVGQMLFPAGTSSEEIATLWYCQAFINYMMFKMSVPGVVMFPGF